MRRRYLKSQLIYNKDNLDRFIGFYATALPNDLWYLDDVTNELKEICKKLKTSINWLTKRIKECNLPPEKQSKSKSYDLDMLRAIPIRQVLSNYNIKVNRAGFFKLRNERTPSAKIYDNNNNFYDFGSGEGGSVIDLIMILENIDFKEACNILSRC